MIFFLHRLTGYTDGRYDDFFKLPDAGCDKTGTVNAIKTS